MKKIFFLLINLLLISGISYSQNSEFVLVIDAGHGGGDPGAVRGKMYEKTVNLAVALEFGRLVERNMPNVKVVYTRKTDVFIPLKDRSKLANKHKANLFISIHVNSSEAKTTSMAGAETYILGLTKSAESLAVAKRENSVIKYEEDYTTKYEGFDPDSPESYIIFEFMTNQYLQQSFDIGSYVQSSFTTSAKRKDRGVKQLGLWVLRDVGMPSILIELGFINNPAEAKYLFSAVGQKAMAAAIYSGFRKYKADFDYKQDAVAHIKASNTPVAKPAESKPTETKPNPKPTNTQPAPKQAEQSTVRESTNIAKTGEVEYRIQFLYTKHLLPENSPLFKDVQPTGYTIDRGYKYTVGATTDYNEIMKIFKDVRTKFSDAFIIRVTASEVSNSVAIPQSSSVPALSNEVAGKKSDNSIPRGITEYRIQFLLSQAKLRDNSPRFKGLTNVGYYVEGGYKYTVGSTTNRAEITKELRSVRTLFPDAFIIRFVDGEKQ